MKLKLKTSDELKLMQTKRLLAYYKAERQRYIAFENSVRCDCCGEFLWDLYPVTNKLDDAENKSREAYAEYAKTHTEWFSYLAQIKSVLGTREHIKKQNEIRREKKCH